MRATKPQETQLGGRMKYELSAVLIVGLLAASPKTCLWAEETPQASDQTMDSKEHHWDMTKWQKSWN